MPLPRLPARGLLLLLLALVFLPALAAQESSWDGNAAVVRKGEFDSPGLFAASDSFPQGTLLRVENPQNGKAVQVTVVDRINGRGNVFLLLSEQAAAVLGLSPSEVIRVKARVLIASIDSARAGSREPAASPDPDVNPAAAVAALPEAAAAKSEATEAPAEAAAAAAEPVAAAGAPVPEPPAEAPPEEPPPEVVTPPAGTALEVSTATASAPEAQPEAPAAPAAERRLEELAARIPQKRLFQPPPESSAVAPEPTIAAPEPTIAASPAEETAIAETVPPVAEEPEGGSLSALPPEPAAQTEALPEGEVPEEPPVAAMAPLPAEATLTEELPLAEAAVAEEPAEATPSLSVSPEPAPAMEPAMAAPTPEIAPGVPLAEATPVLQEPAPEPAIAAPRVAAAPPTAAETPASGTLALLRKSFYLQLGAYSTLGLAEKLAREVSSYARYTVAVLPSSAGARPLYKVLIGPLNRDESGTLLYQFRARGFRDAFLQYIE